MTLFLNLSNDGLRPSDPTRRRIRSVRIAQWSLLGIFALVLLSSAPGDLFASASDSTPIGLWKTIDDNTGQTKGLIRISERSGRFEGKIEKIFPKPGDDPTPRCDKCDGSRQNQPVLGMTILWNLTRQDGEYQGGEILDPENGKIYRAKMKLIDGGKKLEVRGFLGIALFGRSQIWLREK
jgi:uncharacterized protein (DUF2147 family)